MPIGAAWRWFGGALLVLAMVVGGERLGSPIADGFSIRDGGFSALGALSADAAAPYAEILYTADASTRLFDGFEGVTLADSRAPQVTFAPGYLGGQALYFPDTGSYAIYSDSWWANDGEGFQESGTIEFYYRPETFIFTSDRSYGTLLTQDERANSPLTGGLPTLAVFEASDLSWATSRGIGFYWNATAGPPSFPGLYPGQWYHIAATWGSGDLNLYVNGALAATTNSDTFVRTDTFMLGGTGVKPLAEGLAARGRIDRFRLSWRPRIVGEFPAALDVRIDSPTGGQNLYRPFAVTVNASATETRTRTVDLYADTDDQGFNGVSIAQALPESGTFFVGGTLTDTPYYLYAVARAGDDSAFYYLQSAITLVGALPGIGVVVDPVDTVATVLTPVTPADSFLLVMLNGGGVTSGTLSQASDSVGTAANYTVRTRLMNSADSASIYIWTREVTGAIALGVRSDTASLSGSLPRGIPNTVTGRNAFGATVISTEFFRSNGSMIGDTKSTTLMGDSYAYTIDYIFGETTARAFLDLGFDIAAGSRMFAFFYADTYGAAWIEDTTVTVTVLSGSNAGFHVVVSGVTRDLPGGLGAASSSTASIGEAGGSGCVIRDAGAPSWLMAICRFFRDILMECGFGRLMTLVYYAL